MAVRLPMRKRKALGSDSSGASQPTAPGANQRRASRQPMAAMIEESNPAALPPSSGSANSTQPPDPEQQAQLAPLSSGEQKREILELMEQEGVIACFLDNCARGTKATADAHRANANGAAPSPARARDLRAHHRGRLTYSASS